MKKIKFSHDYKKLPEVWQGTQAKLMAVQTMNVSYMKMAIPAFIEYDTTFRNEKGRYDLNFKNALVLFFVHLNTGIPFTTIRSDRVDTDKYHYYLNLVGETFIMEYSGNTEQLEGSGKMDRVKE